MRHVEHLIDAGNLCESRSTLSVVSCFLDHIQLIGNL